MTKIDSMTRRPIPEESADLLAYDAETGVITWKVSKHPIAQGSVAGGVHPDGYRRIGILGKQYQAHRVAWLLHYGEQPPQFLDHINGERDDNRISNIRAVTNAENQRNSRINANNTTGVKGVHFDKTAGRYKAKFKVNTKQVSCGYHDTVEQAAEAIRARREELHGEFAHHG